MSESCANKHDLVLSTPPGVTPLVAFCRQCGHRFMLRDGDTVDIDGEPTPNRSEEP